jgi:hypothetical protein
MRDTTSLYDAARAAGKPQQDCGAATSYQMDGEHSLTPSFNRP